jgi:hypothetical protein
LRIFQTTHLSFGANYLLVGLRKGSPEAISFLQEYKDKEKLYRCSDFMDYVFLDAFKIGFKEINKHGGFPSIEASHQFDYSIKHALSGSYKAAFDSIRSCLEMTLLSVHCALEKHISDDGGFLLLPMEEILAALRNDKNWLRSQSTTPFFSFMLKTIKGNRRFSDFDTLHNWFEELKGNYYIISDFTHINGLKKGSQELNNINSYFFSSSFHNVNLRSFETFLGILIRTIENIGILVSLYNPILLIDLPLEDKFGINEPVGFIHPGQSAMLNHIIPDHYKSYFEKLKVEDEEVIGISQWVNSMPNLTEGEFNIQIESFRNSIKSPVQKGI